MMASGAWGPLWLSSLLAAGSLALALASGMPEVGSMAPDFTLVSQDGSRVSLKDYRGRWVVLYFYPRDFTSGCTREARNFQRDQSLYRERNAVVLGVSTDSADSHRQFCAHEGLGFKLLADGDAQVSRRYGSLLDLWLLKFALRHTFLIDPQGRIAKAFADVSPEHHSEQVLAALAELQRQAGAAR